MTNDMNAAEIIAKIGTVDASEEVDGVLFTLAANVVRVNDVDTGVMVGRTDYHSAARAEAGYAALVAKAKAMV